MRIISGKYKGRIIKMPKGIRPTQDKVRKAIFDILGDIEDVSFLELFSGSGAVGIEALSKGAKRGVFVESNPNCIKALKNNFSYLLPTTYYLLPLDVFLALKQIKRQGQKFEIIFLDPPYYGGLAKKTLQILGAYDILAPNGFIIAQHFKKDILPVRIENLRCFKQARYGDTVLSFYRRQRLVDSSQ